MASSSGYLYPRKAYCTFGTALLEDHDERKGALREAGIDITRLLRIFLETKY